MSAEHDYAIELQGVSFQRGSRDIFDKVDILAVPTVPRAYTVAELEADSDYHARRAAIATFNLLGVQADTGNMDHAYVASACKCHRARSQKPCAPE